MKFNKKDIFVIFILLIVISISIYSNNKKNNQMKELTELTPHYEVERREGIDYEYFQYQDLFFSSFIKDEEFYGLNLKKQGNEFKIFCDINRTMCRVKFFDGKCLLNELPEDSPIEMLSLNLSLGETGCVKIYDIKGTVDKRIY